MSHANTKYLETRHPYLWPPAMRVYQRVHERRREKEGGKRYGMRGEQGRDKMKERESKQSKQEVKKASVFEKRRIGKEKLGLAVQRTVTGVEGDEHGRSIVEVNIIGKER